MKRTKFCIKLRIVPFVAMLFACIAVSAQQISVSGAVTDASGAPVAGATVVEAGTANATMTDGDGGYKISVPRNGRLVFSCVGFSQQTINVNGQSVINVTMEEDETTRLREVVAIGYGTIKKSDATGAVEVLTSKDMNKGPIVTADNLITGRMPGVQVIPNGNPGTGSTIRIRGGASLDANNDPLIVVDGLPLSNASITQINPNDIESFSVLKDASAAAIYGSRASNGVILITTKKGGEGKWKFNFDAQGSVMTLPWKVKTLSQQDFIDAVTNLGQASADKLGYNGVMYNTDWQDQIFGTQAGTSTNFSALGKIGNFMPARITVGYNNTPGLLLTTGYQRTNASVALSPSFFNNTLKIEVNANGSYERYNRADDEGGVIGGAIYFDPTKPVFVNGARDENAKYFGYYEWGADYDPANPNYPINTLASRNPVAMLREVDRHSDVYKLWGNVQAEYSFPFAKGLKAVVNVGLQKERWFEDMMASKYANTIHRVNAIDMPIGSEWHNRGENTNKLLDAYLNYNNTFGAFHLDLTGGYSYQKYQIGTEHNSGDQQMLANGLITEEAVQLNMNRIYTPRCMISFFGRANFSLLERYLLTLTVRNDRSSMFAPDKRSGIFPAASFAWRITEEGFLKDSQAVSNLKLRLGWGITGQQGLFIGDNYNINRYLPLYGSSQDSHSQYPIGNTYYYPVYPMAYDPTLKWEETTTYNAGLDFGFANNRLYGSVDVYYKESKDLFARVQIPAGVNFANEITTNSGAFTTKGIEVGLNYDIIRNNKPGAFNWTVSYNASFNKLEVTDLPLTSSNVRVSVASGGGGIPLGYFEVGQAPYIYNVFKQVYDESGKPIEGVFADLNKDGKLDEDDRYIFHSPAPKFLMGLATNLSFKNFDFSMSWRSSIGNYIYDFTNAMNSYRLQLDPSGSYLRNINSAEYYAPDDTKRRSDEWIKNGSFVKWDNATLGYNFNQIIKGLDMRAYFSVQNILCITKAGVPDPEVAIGGGDAGIVRNLYPRPRTFLLGFNFSF